jgi:hypothetical protein
MLQHLRVQLEEAFNGVGSDVRAGIIMQQLLTIVFSIWFKQLVLTGPNTFHYNGHSLLLCPSFGSVPKLALVPCKKVSSRFPMMVEF